MRFYANLGRFTLMIFMFTVQFFFSKDVELIILLHPRQLQLTMKAVVLNGQLQAKRMQQVGNIEILNVNLFPDKVEKDMGSFDQLPLGTILPWVSRPSKLGCLGVMNL